MRFGSLFSGIGGLDLGLERAGIECRWQVEIDPFCRRVLLKHWPNVPKHDNVQTFPPTDPEDWRVDIIAGGFPCQDISSAGNRAGIDGKRSGLWAEFSRIVGVVRPRYVLVENVPAIVIRGLGRVLGDLARLGYDAEWESLSAHQFGADHIRVRTFVVASRRSLPDSDRERRKQFDTSPESDYPEFFGRSVVPHGSRWEPTQPVVVRGIHGIPRRVDRIGALGNAVVPQVAEWIGRRIIEHAGA